MSIRVRIYRNLHRPECYSIQAKGPQGWRVLAYASSAILADVKLTVRPGGRASVLATGRKVVHAWAEGTLVAWNTCPDAPPYRMEAERDMSVSCAIVSHLPNVRAIDRSRAAILGQPIRYNPRHAATFTRGDGSAITSAPTVALGFTDGRPSMLAIDATPRALALA